VAELEKDESKAKCGENGGGSCQNHFMSGGLTIGAYTQSGPHGHLGGTCAGSSGVRIGNVACIAAEILDNSQGQHRGYVGLDWLHEKY
jgi:hypothetical protein